MIYRYKYTIILAIIFAAISVLLVMFINHKNDCEKRGGIYVKTFDNRYECVEELR